MLADKELKDYSYEEAMEKLEDILSKMDRGEVPLDESMKNFEEGMKLIKHCEDIINSYERRITKIVGEKNGEIIEEDIEF